MPSVDHARQQVDSEAYKNEEGRAMAPIWVWLLVLVLVIAFYWFLTKDVRKAEDEQHQKMD